ncbi:MAG: hypothetical protein ACRC1M_07460 [Methanobacteriaceae archaeon]
MDEIFICIATGVSCYFVSGGFVCFVAGFFRSRGPSSRRIKSK